MNTYIIPIYNNKKVYITKISARSENECKDKLIEKFADKSESEDYNIFLKELKYQNIIIGEITDIETL